MPSPFSPELLKDVEDRLFEMAAALEDELVRSLLGSRRVAYGDVTLSRPERILKFVDDRERGVVDALDQLDPDEANRRRRQFQFDVEREVF